MPEDQPLHIHLAARGLAHLPPGRIPPSPTPTRASSVALEPPNLAAVAKLHDDKRRMWRLRDADDASELAVVCTAVRGTRRENEPRRGGALRRVSQGPAEGGAHKRAVAAKMAEHASDRRARRHL